MKKQILAISVMLASVLSFTNCTKEDLKGAATEEGAKFSLTATIAGTRTANDGLKTVWVDGDAINLFHAEAGSSTFASDGEFNLKDAATGSFEGTLGGELTASSYDWYAFYPYSSYMTAPDGSKGYVMLGHNAGSSISQSGNSSRAHLAGKALPLYAKATVGAGEPVVLGMENLASVVKVVVTNTVDNPLTVSEVKFVSTEDIVGTYYYDLTKVPVVYKASGASYVSSTATLKVNGGTALAKGESAEFYIPVKPHTASAGSELKLSVNGYEKPLTLENDVTFVAGSIKPVNFAYDNTEVIANYVEIPWSEDFSGALSLYTLTNGGTETKAMPTDALAGGSAPELLVSKSGGSFAANVNALAGTYVLTFKSNYPDRLTISADNGVTVSKVSNTEYNLGVPADVVFTLTFKNTNSSNTRLDDILVKILLPELSAPANLTCTAQTDNSLTFAWDAVANAIGYQVSLDGGITYLPVQSENSYVWSDLPSGTTMDFYVKAVGDGVSYEDSPEISVQGTTTGESSSTAVEVTLGSDWNAVFGTSYTGTISGIKANGLTLSGAENGVSIEVKNGTSVNGYVKTGDFRAYNGYTITLSAPSGSNITKISTTKGGKTFSSGITANVGNGQISNNAYSWAGSSNTVVLTITGTVSFATIVVTYE